MSETDNVNECLSHFVAHSETLTRLEKRTDRIEDTIKSMPSEIQQIKETINKLSVTMEKLLEKLEAKYVSKELYEANIESIISAYTDYKVETDKKIEKLDRRVDWLLRGLVISCLYILKDIFVKYLHI